MMKKTFLTLVLCFGISTNAMSATNLLQVFNAALNCDPSYQEVVTQTLSTDENISISRAALLPNIRFRGIGEFDKLGASGAEVRSGFLPPSTHLRSFDGRLSLTQTIFNFAQFAALSKDNTYAREANAKLNSAVQDLMIRVAQAYFNVLNDEDNLAYYEANKKTYEKQLSVAKQLYKDGSGTKTDIDTAKSAHGAAVADYVTAQAQLLTDKEFLATLTGQKVISLAKLNDKIPLIAPEPADMNAWVCKAEQQNWTIKAHQFAVLAARELIKEKFAGHLPTLNSRVSYDVNPLYSSAGSIFYSKGSSRTTDTAVALELDVPIFAGGEVVSTTRQAQLKFKLEQQKLEAVFRNIGYKTRTSYINIISNLEKIRGDHLTVQSAHDALMGLQERYRIGEGTLTDVLRQQEKLIQARSQFSSHRYAYIMNFLNLKYAAGTLGAQDLELINSWLTKTA